MAALLLMMPGLFACGWTTEAGLAGQVQVGRLIVPGDEAEPGAVVPVRIEISGSPVAVHWSAPEGVFQDPRSLSTRYVCPQQEPSNPRDLNLVVEVFRPDGTVERRMGAIRLVPAGPPDRMRRAS